MSTKKELNVLIKAKGTQSSPIVKESIVNESSIKESKKYIKRELPTYFDMKKVDFAVVEQFLLVAPSEININKKKTSIATAYHILNNSYATVLQKDKDFMPVIKRMYSFMIRYTIYSRFTSIVGILLKIRLASTLSVKIFNELMKPQVNIENLYNKESSEFPNQEQTFSKIEIITRELIVQMNQSALDIISHIRTLHLPGISEFNNNILNILFKDFEIKSQDWKDLHYLHYILTTHKHNKKIMTKNFDSVQLKQLYTYIDDLYIQMSMIFIPYQCLLNTTRGLPIEEQVKADIDDALEKYELKGVVITNLITLDPQIFVTGGMISATQYKNILLSLENVIRDISIMGCKNYGQVLVPLLDQIMLLKPSE